MSQEHSTIDANRLRFSPSNVVVIVTATIQTLVFFFMLKSENAATNSRVDLLEQKINYQASEIQAGKDHDDIQDLALRTYAANMGVGIRDEDKPKIKRR